MKGVITNAAEITVLQPIDNTYKTGGGPVSVGGCVIVASKGRPFTVHEVFGTDTSQEDIFGSPLPKKAYGMEGLRHLSEAAKECNWVQTVRVVNQKEYRYPSLGFIFYRERGEWDSKTDYAPGDVVSCDGQSYIAAADVAASTTPPVTGTGDWMEYSGPVEKDAHRHNESVIVGDDGFWLVVYPIDGDASTRRTLRIEDVDTERRRFKLAFYDVDDTGYEYCLESHLVGIGEDDKDDMGRPAYIETVLETQSKRFRCDFLEGVAWEALEAVLLDLEDKKARPHSFSFEGGTSGGQPENDDWFKAVELLRRESMPLNMIFAAGLMEQDIIARLAEIADFRHIGFYFDVPAISRKTAPSNGSRNWASTPAMPAPTTAPTRPRTHGVAAKRCGASPARWWPPRPAGTRTSPRMFRASTIPPQVKSAATWRARALPPCSRSRTSTATPSTRPGSTPSST